MKSIIVFLIVINTIFSIDTIGDVKFVGGMKKIKNDEIKSLAEDKKGFIWFATDEGLNRYDGREVKLYRKNIFDEYSLKDNEVRKVFMDIEGNLWIASSSYLHFYQYNTDNFLSYEFDSEILDITQGDNSNLLILTNNKLLEFDYLEGESNKLLRVKDAEKILFADSKGLILSANRSIYTFDYQDKYLIWNEEFKGYLKMPLRSFLWKGNTIYNYNTLDVELEFEEEIITVGKHSNYEVFIVTEKSVFAYNTISNKLTKLNMIKDREVREAFFTQNNYLFLATDKGLEFFALKHSEFRSKVFDERVKHIFGTRENIYITLDERNLWRIGRSGEMDLLDTEGVEGVNQSNDSVIITSKKGSIIEIGKDSFERTEVGIRGIENISVDQDYFWFNIGAKFYRMNKDGSGIKVYGDFSTKKYEIVVIEEDKKDNNILWIGAKGLGLVKFYKDLEEHVIYNRVEKGGESYSFTGVNAISQGENYVYFYSEDASLMYLDRSSDNIRDFGIDISQQRLLNIIVDSYGNIWFYTKDQLAKIDKKNKLIRYFGREDGIEVEGFKKGSLYIGERVYIGGENGYVSFNPREVGATSDVAEIVFRSIFFNKTSEKRELSYLEEIEIPYNNKAITISFDKLDYESNREYNFVYKILGRDSSWKSLGLENSVSFASLPKGKNILKIRYYTDNNSLSQAEATLILNVAEAPWETTPAYVLYVSLILLAAYYIYKYNVNGRQLNMHIEVDKLVQVLKNTNNASDMIAEFMKKSVSYFGVEGVELRIKENKQNYVNFYAYKYRENFLEEELIKDNDDISLKKKKIGVYFELETDIVNKISLARIVEDGYVRFVFEVENRFSGIFEYKDTEIRNGKDRYLYKSELLLRQFLINYMSRVSFEQLTELANYDSLTKTYNRRYFDIVSQMTLEQARRYKHDLSIAILDIDFFKKVNDTYGHKVGDKVLVEYSERIKESIRETDILGRYGGEEFIICFTETNRARAMKVADRIRKVIEEQPFDTGVGMINITTTIGIAEYRVGDNLDKLFQRADLALYSGKRDGRNRSIIYHNNKEIYVDVALLLNS